MAIFRDFSEKMPMKPSKLKKRTTNTWKQVIQHHNSGNILKSKVARNFASLLPIALVLLRKRATISVKITLFWIKI